MPHRTVIAILWAALGLAACTANSSNLMLTANEPSVADIQTVHIATTRKASDDPLELFSGERAQGVNYAVIDVSVPKNREPGSTNKADGKPDPAKHFAPTRIDTGKSRETLKADINSSLANQGNGLVVFVHGYNNSFANGLYRLAQLAEDYDIQGAALAYSWPSAGRAPLYLYDRDSAQFARTGLVDTIRLATETQANDIVLVAHSMGTLILMEALRELSISGERDVLKKINAVVLAAPDIDVDVFRSQIADISPRPQAFAVFVSSRDRALQVSQRVRGGHPRVGEGTNIEALRKEGVVVFDLSTIRDGGDRTQHSTFASSPTMIALARSGAIGRQSLVNQNADDATIGQGVERLFDLASDIVYLPVTIANQ